MLRQIWRWWNQDGWDCRGMQQWWETHTTFWSGNLKGRINQENLGIDKKQILQRMLMYQNKNHLLTLLITVRDLAFYKTQRRSNLSSLRCHYEFMSLYISVKNLFFLVLPGALNWHLIYMSLYFWKIYIVSFLTLRYYLRDQQKLRYQQKPETART